MRNKCCQLVSRRLSRHDLITFFFNYSLLKGSRENMCVQSRWRGRFCGRVSVIFFARVPRGGVEICQCILWKQSRELPHCACTFLHGNGVNHLWRGCAGSAWNSTSPWILLHPINTWLPELTRRKTTTSSHEKMNWKNPSERKERQSRLKLRNITWTRSASEKKK